MNSLLTCYKNCLIEEAIYMVVFVFLIFLIPLCCFQSDSALFLCSRIVVSRKAYEYDCISKGHKNSCKVQNIKDMILLSCCFINLCHDSI